MPMKKMRNGGSAGRRARRNRPSVADQYEAEGSNRDEMPRTEVEAFSAASSTPPQPNPRRQTPQQRPREVEDRAAAIRAAERGNDAARRYAEDEMDVKDFAEGGMVRGCKSSQTSGKGFRGTY